MKLRVRFALVTAAILCVHLQIRAQTADSALRKLEFLLGNWTGVAGPKDTPLGAGQGAFSFEPGLNRKIMTRRNAAAYDNGVRHEDLMVIYFEDSGPQAIYFDSEGHVIRYKVTTPAAEKAVFESDSAEPGPRYRLTYWMEKGNLRGTFEIAAPGRDYKPYMTWTSKKS